MAGYLGNKMSCPYKLVDATGPFTLSYTDQNGQPQFLPYQTNGQCSIFVLEKSIQCPIMTVGNLGGMAPQQQMVGSTARELETFGNMAYQQQQRMVGNLRNELPQQRVSQGPQQQINQIVQLFANQIAGDDDDKFAVLVAIKSKDLKKLETILTQNVDITVTDQEGNNIFHLICLQEREEDALEILQVIYKFQSHYGSHFLKLLNEAHNVSGHWPIHEASFKGHGKLIEVLKNKGALLNIQTTRTEETCMIIAAKNRDKELVRKLIDLDACVNLINNSKMAAIHPAIKDGDDGLMEYFFANNVDVYDVKNYTKNEAIIERCKNHMKERKKRKKKENHPEYPLDSKRRRRCKCGSQANIEIPANSPQELNFH